MDVGPGAYNMEQKTTTSKSGTGTRIASGDRYALLQRKVEELERLHAESKKNVSACSTIWDSSY